MAYKWQQICSSALCGPQRGRIPRGVVLLYSVATLGPFQHGAVRARFARGGLKFVSSHAGACRTEHEVTAASSSRVSGLGSVSGAAPLPRARHQQRRRICVCHVSSHTCERDRSSQGRNVSKRSCSCSLFFCFAPPGPPCQIFPRHPALR